jgi:hypothetical protein
MVGKSVSVIAASVVAVGMLGAPATSAAQDRSSVVVQCGPGQRAVMEQRQSYRGSRTVARCVSSRRNVNSGYGRARYAPSGSYDSYRPVRQRAYYERAPRRSKAKTALMIAGSAATGAGVGGAIKGKKGALIGAAIGGGTASIYEAAKRR